MEPTPTTGAQTIHPNSEKNSVPVLVLSDAAKKYKMFRRSRLIAARDARDTPREETDDMPFLKYIGILKRADDQYVAPRKNKQDTSVNTGTIRDKDTSLVEYATKHDFEPVAQCYDEDDEMMLELAETGEDLVKKSLQLEEWKDKAKLIYRSQVAFGTALVEDQWVERWTLEKEYGKDSTFGDIDFKWTEKKVKTYDGCQAKLWDIRKCYPGDIKKFFMNGPQGQPYFFTVEYESYDVTKQMFGEFERWKYVPTQVTMTAEVANAIQWSDSWTLRPITQNYCEIVRYYDPVGNEYALSINDIDMLPIMEKEVKGEDGQTKTLISGFPLTVVSPSGAIPFAKYDLEPMHDHFYSKAQPAKMRVFGDIENMILKLFIGMLKQKAKPTLGNKSGRNFGPEVTDPATVVNDIRDGDLFPILPDYKGPDGSDFSMYELVKKELSKNSVEDSWQGIKTQPGEESATKDMNDRKSQSLKVASLFDGIISGNKQLYWLRTYMVAAKWTKPIDVQIDAFKKTIINKYRTVTVASEIDGGQKATKKIIFTKDTPVRPQGKPTLEDSMNVHQEEIDALKEGKGETRRTYLHPELFATMRMNWFYTCIPVPNDSDPLAYMMFSKQITDAIAFFGPDSLNVKKLKHRFAAITGNDFDTWFISQQELDQKQQTAQQQATLAASGGAPGTVPGKPVAGGPTIAGAASGANIMQSMGSIMK